VLIATSGREMFPDVMLPKYGSVENRYSIFESTIADIRIPHFVGLFELYVINNILPLNVTRFIKSNYLI
jgi:hypothetical protein